MKIFRILNFILLALALFGFANGALAWVEPTTAPPGNNLFAPLSSSALGQSKTGGLILNLGNAAYGLIVKSGLVGIGTDNPRAELEVAGKIKATGLKINSTGRGVLLPRTTPDKVVSPVEGMIIYDTAQKKFYFFAAGTWKSIEDAVTDDRKVIEYTDGDGRTDDYYCKKKNITADGMQEDWVNINEGKVCGVNDKICQAGVCKELSCTLDFYKTGLVCSFVGIGYYSPIGDNNRYACTNKPTNSTYTGSGGGANNCPWSCDSGYTQSGSSCVKLPAKSITVIDSGYGAKIAIAPDGFPSIGYVKGSNVMFAHCTDADCVNKNIVTVAPSAWLVTSFTIGPDGFARMTYQSSAGRNIKLIRCQDINCSNKTITNVSSGDMTGGAASLSYKNNGLPMVSYSDNPYEFESSWMQFASCSDADCVNKNLKTIDYSGYGSANVTTPDGLPTMAYFSGKVGSSWNPTYPNLKLIKCVDTNCSSFSSNTVDSATCYGSLKIVLGADALPRLLYDDTAGPKFVRCLDSLCTAKNVSVTDSDNKRSSDSLSMALGSDGMARIGYQFAPSEDLKFIRCTDIDCVNKKVSTLDSNGNVGYRASLVLGVDGLARIVYQDITNLRVKFIRCNNDNCSD